MYTRMYLINFILIMFFLALIPFFSYVKKQDVPYYLSRARIFTAVFYAFLGALDTLFYLVVYPKMRNIFLNFKLELPWQMSYYPVFFYTTLTLFLGMFFYLLLNRDARKKETELKLSKYKEGEMVNIKDFVDGRLGLFSFFIAGIFIILTMLLLVVPLYDLTARL